MTTTDDPSPAPHTPLLDTVTERLGSCALPAEAVALIREALADLDAPQDASLRGVYLKSVTAEGFRGIGPAVTLDLTTGPGLTVIQGRNGSGKSSFAEGIEVAVTGHNRRWEDEDGKVVQGLQRDGWRNLHHTGPCHLAVELQASGRPDPVVIDRTWNAGDDFERSTATVSGLGPTSLPLSALGWEEDLRAFRPILSYSELGQMMVSKPSRMYDRLASLLGLGPLSLAGERLAGREKELAAADKQAKAALPPLLAALSGTQDERAQQAATVIAKRIPDHESIRSLIAGAPLADTTELAQLHRVAALTGPDPEVVATAVARLREALASAEDARHTDAGEALAHADLLDQALRVRSQHPNDHDCPVCQSPNRLDDTWVDAATARADQLRSTAAEATKARHELRQSAADLRSMAQNRPAELPQSLHGVWDEWAACRTIQDLDELAGSAEKRSLILADACRVIRQEAEQRLAAQDEQWRLVAPQLAAWLGLADAAVAAKPVIAQVKKARAWLKDTHAELRDTKMQAIADTAQQIWGYLSQESNVSLGAVNLTGSDAYSGRGVQLNVTVDDLDASALGVVSQGELFSLALSLFLPRAMAKESPFDFIVIDDPVQSMDPRKVEGLARLLDMIAKTHQVVVFTHDTRLPDALRFHRINATIVEVGRHRQSSVTVRTADDPVKHELAAARAVAKDPKVPAAVLGEILPGQCRIALEAALQESARRTLFAAGRDHHVIEERISAARELTDLAALALFGERSPGADKPSKTEVYQELTSRLGVDCSDFITLCNKGSHSTIPIPGREQALAFIDRATVVSKGLREL
jgi:ABC-type lipoprotein export system ATPase subunit